MPSRWSSSSSAIRSRPSTQSTASPSQRRRGEVFGLLGPNGAGKTTTVGMLTTRVRPTAGAARIGGVDVVARSGPGAAAARGRAAAQQPRPLDLDPRQPDLPRRLPRRPGARARGAGRRAARAVRAARPGGGQARLLLRRPVAARDDRPRADARAAGAVPRRADDRPRPGGAPVRLGPPARAARRGRDAHPDDARHGRGGRARGPGRDHGSRQAARARHARGADALARGRRRRSSSTADRPADGAVVDALAALAGVERVERPRRGRGRRPGAPPPDARRSACGSTSPATRALLVAPAAAVLAEHGLALDDVKLGAPTLEDVFIHLTGRTLR